MTVTLTKIIEPLEDAVHAWFTEATGLTTIWRDQSAPSPDYPYASLSRISGPLAVSPHWDESQNFDASREVGKEIELLGSVPCTMTISCQAYTALEGLSAEEYMVAAMKALSKESAKSLLRVSGLAVSSVGNVQSIPQVINGNSVRRVNMDVVFLITLTETDYVTYIESVAISADAFGLDVVIGGSTMATDAEISDHIAATNPHSNSAPAHIQVLPGTGLTGGGTLETDRTLTLADTSVTPGSYQSPNVTIDQQGRITDATENLLLSVADEEINLTTSGSDSTGDGSVGAPYATLDKVYERLANRIGHRLRVRIGAGTYVNTISAGLRRQFTGGGCVAFESAAAPTVVEAGPFTANTVTLVGSGWVATSLNFTGGTLTPNAHKMQFIQILTGTNAGQILPIFSHGTGSMVVNWSPTSIADTDTFNIVKPSVIIQQDTGASWNVVELDYHPNSEAVDKFSQARIGFDGIQFESSQSFDNLGSFIFAGGSFVNTFCNFKQTANDTAIVGLRNATINKEALADLSAFTRSFANVVHTWGFCAENNNGVITDIDTTVSMQTGRNFIQGLCTQGRVEAEIGVEHSLVSRSMAQMIRATSTRVRASMYLDPTQAPANTDPGVSLTQAIADVTGCYVAASGGDGYYLVGSTVRGFYPETVKANIVGYGVRIKNTSTFVVLLTVWGRPEGTTGDLIFEMGPSTPAWPTIGNGVTDSLGSVVITES